MSISKKVTSILLPMFAVALACAMAPMAFAAQGDASLSGVSIIGVQADDDISEANVSVSDQTYTGNALKPAVKVVLDGKTLAADKDYTVAYSNNTNAGTANVTVTGKGDYSGKATETFKINPANASGFVIADISDKTYNGDAFKPAPKVTFKGKKLDNGTDYKLSYASNKNAGKATVTVTGKGNFTGEKDKKFRIEKAPLEKVKIEAIPNKTYTGKAITVSIKATYKGDKVKVGSDVTAKYKKNTDVGTAEVVLTTGDNFKGKQVKEFKIVPAKLKKADMAAMGAYTYTGSAIQPSPAIKFSGDTLKRGADYTLSYKANTNAGTATVVATGKKNFTGTLKGTFRINPAPMSGVSVGAIAARAYTGKAITPNPAITFKGKTLKKDADYTLSYSNNLNRGTAQVVITGKGNFAGTRNTSFSIVQASLAKAKIVKIPTQKYTGQPIEPALTVKYAGRTLVRNTDYTVTYSNNVAKGKGVATIQGIGNYTGQNSKKFNIK